MVDVLGVLKAMLVMAILIGCVMAVTLSIYAVGDLVFSGGGALGDLKEEAVVTIDEVEQPWFWALKLADAAPGSGAGWKPRDVIASSIGVLFAIPVLALTYMVAKEILSGS